MSEPKEIIMIQEEKNQQENQPNIQHISLLTQEQVEGDRIVQPQPQKYAEIEQKLLFENTINLDNSVYTIYSVPQCYEEETVMKDQNNQKEIQSQNATVQVQPIAEQPSSTEPDKVPVQNSQQHAQQSETINEKDMIDSQKQIQQITQLINTQDMHNMKQNILSILPDLADKINQINQQQLKEMYEEIRNQLKLNQTHNNIVEEHIQVQTQINPDVAIPLPYEDHHPTQIVNHQQVLQQASPIDQQQPSSKAGKQIQKNGNQLAVVFETYKHLNTQELRQKFIEHFPQNEAALKVMETQQLRQILQQVSNQIERQNKPTQLVTSISKEPNHSQLQSTNQAQHLKKPVHIELEPQQIQTNPPNKVNDEIHNVNDKPKLNLKQILSYVEKELPHLKDNLKLLSQAQIRNVYEQVMATCKDTNNPQTLQQPSPNSQTSAQLQQSKPIQVKPVAQPQIIQEQYDISIDVTSSGAIVQQAGNDIAKTTAIDLDSQPSIEPVEPKNNQQNHNLKRSHEQINKNQGNKKIGKFNIADLRGKLIVKMPDLKGNIMMLDDRQIQKIFLQSIEYSKNKKDSKQKEEKTASKTHNKTNTSASQQDKKELFKKQTDKASTQLVEFNSNKTKKRCKTIILMHTEEDDDECQESPLTKKAKVGETLLKKCQCDCCKKHEQIPFAFRKIIECLAKNDK